MMKEHALMRYFEYEHLPEGPVQAMSYNFYKLAHALADGYDMRVQPYDIAEAVTALRKLLEAKDCAVRAQLFE